MTWPNTIKGFTSTEWKIFLWVVALSVFAKGIGLFSLGYATDDYAYMLLTSYDLAGEGAGVLANGRFLGYLLYKWAYALGGGGPGAAAFHGGLMLVVMAASGIMVGRLWGVRPGVMGGLAACGLLCLHPYQIELFTFKLVLLNTAFGLACAFLGLHLCQPKPVPFALACLCIIASLAIYQVSLHFLVAALLLLAVFRWLNEGEEHGKPSWREALGSRDYLDKWLMLGVSTGLYYLMARWIAAWAGVATSSRSQLLGSAQWGTRSAEIGSLIRKMLFRAEPLIAGEAKLGLLLILAAAFAVVGWRSLSRGRRGYVLVDLAMVTGLLALALLGVVGLAAVSGSWWPMPRVLCALGLFWMGVFCVALTGIRGWMRTALLLVGLAVLMVFAASNNRVLSEQQRVNLRDQMLASRIIARLEAHPDFGKVQRVALVGGFFTYREPLATAIGDMNISAFGAAWSRLPLLREVSGYDLRGPTARDRELAAKFSRTASKWPHPKSVTVMGDLAIVCLPE